MTKVVHAHVATELRRLERRQPVAGAERVAAQGVTGGALGRAEEQVIATKAEPGNVLAEHLQ
jgi:hypothetical protein